MVFYQNSESSGYPCQREIPPLETHESLFQLDSLKPEVTEPALGCFVAVADDEVVTAFSQVAHVETYLSVGIGGAFFTKQNLALRVADGHRTDTHVFMKIHIKSITDVARLDVRRTHVAIAQRTFDVDLVLVADEIVVAGLFMTRTYNQSENYCEN